jgi:glycosyltransferase involved in cell wall biosynthesis
VAIQLPNSGLRVFVLTPGFPPEVGGQEIHLLELCESLIAAGAAVRVLTRRVERSFPAAEYLGKVPVERLSPFGETKGMGFRAIPRLGLLLCKIVWRLLRKVHEYDVILVSGYNILPLAAVLSCAVTRKPCVVRPESPLELTEAVGADSRRRMGLSERSIAMRFLERLRLSAARKVDCYIAISSEIRAGLVTAGIDSGKIVAIPNGINTGKFVPVSDARRLELRAELRLPANKLLLIYTGRLAVSKGVMMLIDVWRELAPKYPDAHLVLAGTGLGSFDNCEAELHAFVTAHGLEHRVTSTGNVTNVHEYLQACDIFVFPSDYEGFGLSILEALAVGLPMVGTRVGVATDVAGASEIALLVPPKDRACFRDALQRILGDAALQGQLGARARAAVCAEYSMSAVARRHMELFSELTGGSDESS